MLEYLRRMDVRGYAEMVTDRIHWRRLVLEGLSLVCSAKEEEEDSFAK